MSRKFFLISVLCAAVLFSGCAGAQPEIYGSVVKKGDVLWNDGIDETGVADGAFTEYINVRRVTRPDFRIVQDGGSGTISFQVSASWTPGTDCTAAVYDDVGLDFYGSATFAGAITKLIDDGAKMRTAACMKLVFTVAGAAADASYSIEQALELSRD